MVYEPTRTGSRSNEQRKAKDALRARIRRARRTPEQRAKVALAAKRKREECKTESATCETCSNYFKFDPRDGAGRYCSRKCRNERCGLAGIDLTTKKRTRLYRIWHGMRGRCNDPKHHAYHNYGGRGIKICDEWVDDFPTFKAWAESSGYSDDLCIERNDNNGVYCPENCSWIPRAMQGRNQRKNIRITAFGETKKIFEWAEDARCAVTLGNLYTRWYSPHWNKNPEILISYPASKFNTNFNQWE